MISIEKRAPPAALVTYRAQLDTSSDPPQPARYDGPGFEEVKPAVRAALVAEQGALCCYCTDRIYANATGMKIEHRVAQSVDASRDLEWSNLFGACCGEIPNPSGRGAQTLHCDSAKGDLAITLDPSEATHIQALFYSRDGTLRSARADHQADIDDVLNLNADPLRKRRNDALDEQKRELARRFRGKPLPVDKLKVLLANYRAPARERRPFVGYLCWWLDRTVGKLSTQP